MPWRHNKKTSTNPAGPHPESSESSQLFSSRLILATNLDSYSVVTFLIITYMLWKGKGEKAKD
ncbi:hypothetical protein MTHERMOG20_24370 [Moorella thermoacetica]|nr:hypothetical protein MTHERMOG20_24370 [Moorella thermoacetica]